MAKYYIINKESDDLAIKVDGNHTEKISNYDFHTGIDLITYSSPWKIDKENIEITEEQYNHLKKKALAKINQSFNA